MSSAFGELRPTAYIDSDGREIRADEWATPFEWQPSLEELLADDVVERLDEYPFRLGYALGSWHRETSGASGMVINHFSNDLVILLRQTRLGDGRSAARAARAIYEELVTYAELKSSASAAARYEAHASVTADLMNSRRAGLNLLDRKQREREGDRLRRVARRGSAALKSALAAYGSSFRRQWATDSLFDMAKRHGLDQEYDGYRILSGVMHGTSGALSGTRMAKGKRVVHRLGADYHLSAMAYVEGLRWANMLIDLLPEAQKAPWDSQTLGEATENLIGDYSALFAALRKLDNRLWPSQDIPNPMALLAFYPKGERWYFFDPRFETVTPADAPAEEPQGIGEMRDRYKSYDPETFLGRPMTVVMLNTVVTPRAGAQTAAASSIMVPKQRPANLKAC